MTKNESNLDYYEVSLWYENKWLLLKTTCNNADYLYNLDKDSDNEIKIGIRPVFTDNSKGKLYYNSFRV